MRYILILFCSLMPLAAGGAEYHVDKSEDNLVQFVSEVPLGEFDVKTSDIDGYVYWDGLSVPPIESQLKSSELYFEVQLNSLDAGNSMYNRHMKEDYLETKEYPYASYKGRITEIVPETDSSFTVRTKGDFTIHGKSKTLELTGEVFQIGDTMDVTCKFDVRMSDYDIKVPKLMFIKADNDIDVNLNFYIRPSAYGGTDK
jgi:polyisoprenoid-binding protein YceI